MGKRLSGQNAGISYEKEEGNFLEKFSRSLPRVTLRESSPLLLHLKSAMEKADIWLEPDGYLTASLIFSVIPPVLFSIIAITFFVLGVRGPLEITFIILVPVSFLLTLYILLAFPDYKASSRRREISRDLEQAYTFISALANADVPLDIIFSRLSSERAFGEVSREAEKIVRLTAEGGMDIYTAMNIASRTSPSEEWRAFLQGAIATATSGSRLKPYFVEKALNFHERMRLSVRSNSEAISLFAEVYVTVGVAFPLFLAIILGVMSVISAPVSSSSQLVLLIFSFLIEPVIIVSFIAIVSSLNREVDIG